ncbi:hypothetical protein 10S11_61 [uncultured Caudovirales phage]|uniref:HTH cro/C1-type domain-containing protein n=1 Tax=uncultured Caudovirales phage TaxID=2100421 RepID=A0A2H4J358_9CAUD|nr:hypothetical protein 10S11_61 [uncultured Caudovirales phage]
MLKTARKAKGLSQKNLGEMLGKTQSYVSQLERDKYKNVTINLIRKLSIALELDPADVFFYFYNG